SRFSDASSACFVMLDITRSSSPAACLLFLPGILYTIPPSPRRNPSFPMPVKSRSFHKSACPCRSVQRPTGPPGHILPPASAAKDAPSSSSRTPCPSFGEGCGCRQAPPSPDAVPPGSRPRKPCSEGSRSATAASLSAAAWSAPGGTSAQCAPAPDVSPALPSAGCPHRPPSRTPPQSAPICFRRQLLLAQAVSSSPCFSSLPLHPSQRVWRARHIGDIFQRKVTAVPPPVSAVANL